MAQALNATDSELKELMLGMPTARYAEWILNEMNWGGENEIVTLANHFGVEVAVVSCESMSVMVYGTGAAAESRIYILYTGQHYDPIIGIRDDAEDEVKMLPLRVPKEFDDSAVQIARAHVIEAEKKAKERRVKRIKCLGCGAICDDTQAFQDNQKTRGVCNLTSLSDCCLPAGIRHCMTIEHDDDFAYDCEEIEVVEQADEAIPDGRLDLSSALTFYNMPDVWFSPMFESTMDIQAIDGTSTITTFRSVEHYMQWCRFCTNAQEFATSLLDVPAADLALIVASADFGFQRADWEDVRPAVLLRATKAKVAQNSEIASLLRATGDQTLVHIDSDPWAGVQAGDGIPTGRNAVGNAWMEVRNNL